MMKNIHHIIAIAIVSICTIQVMALAEANDVEKMAGIDVSHHQGQVDWEAVKEAGIKFAFIKATEGMSFKDPKFEANYAASREAGIVRGAYHFARPDQSSGTEQANYFWQNGGKWSPDGLTLPGVLDLEPSSSCSGLSTEAMQEWIEDFYITYKYESRSTRDVVIYTSKSWWDKCTGNWTGMTAKSPLWVAHWGVEKPALPAGWNVYTFWQHTDKGRVNGVNGNVDRDWFNGNNERLLALANNSN